MHVRGFKQEGSQAQDKDMGEECPWWGHEDEGQSLSDEGKVTVR